MIVLGVFAIGLLVLILWPKHSASASISESLGTGGTTVAELAELLK